MSTQTAALFRAVLFLARMHRVEQETGRAFH